MHALLAGTIAVLLDSEALVQELEPTGIAQPFRSLLSVHAQAQTKGPYMLCSQPIIELRRENQT